MADLSLVGVCCGHTGGIWCVQFSPVDQCLATASADGTVKMWALSNFSCVRVRRDTFFSDAVDYVFSLVTALCP